MAYTISTMFAIYFVLWWIVLFLTLPFGVRSQHEDGGGAPGTDPGAPIASQMGRKLIWTTVLSALIFAVTILANASTPPPAAVETMKALGVYDALKPKIVQGNSIAQAFQFVDTRNAELGFVALSQLQGVTEGTRWPVPMKLHAPIFQDAVLLKTGANSEASKAFLAFLKSPEARAIIAKFGYVLELS